MTNSAQKSFSQKWFNWRILFCQCLIYFSTPCSEILAQSYFGTAYNWGFRKIEVHLEGCLCSECACDIELVNPFSPPVHALAMSSDGKLYGLQVTPDSINKLLEIDTLTGNYTEVFTYDFGPHYLHNLASTEPGIFYSAAFPWDFSSFYYLYRTDITNGIVTNLGLFNFNATWGGEMTMFQGEMYVNYRDYSPPFYGIARVDIADPANSELVCVLDFDQMPWGLTASNICNTLLATRQNPNIIYTINLLDCAVTPVCDIDQGFHISTMNEFQEPTICGNELDLDCNDSSGADDADFNAPDFDCLTDPVRISDIDIGMLYDAIIDQVTVQVVGFMPNAPFEILISTGTVPNIDVSGSGTVQITLSNAGGARSTDFKAAIKLIRYDNVAEYPIEGLRNVEVQFTTVEGSMSNIATAFIQVNELPLVPVDLGDDVQVCEGVSTTFDAGVPGAEYEWSTGDVTQIITVDEEGDYIVTVADGINCPGIDTVFLETLPVIDVSLSGDTESCDNESVNLIIITDTPFSLSIDIASNPGNPFSFPNVNGNTSFTDLINEETTYTITLVTPSQDACITITDPEHIVDVYPSFNHSVEVSICDGDSVWLGFYWETEAGVYENTFDSFDGCDSVVTTTIHVGPAIQLNAQGATCDSSEVGIFITTIDNPNGCDTTITTTITLAPSDTTQQNSASCIFTQTGIITDTLSNLAGCDSLIISTISYTPPSDTTFVSASTCDSAHLVVSQLIIPAQDGCDSLIITMTTFAALDTSYASGISCDSASIGVFHTLLQNQQGCDSLVILTVTAGIPDSTYTSTTSCDSSSLGMFEYHFTNIAGCDSVVFQTVSYSAVDSIFLNSGSCDVTQSGVFVSQYVNQFGCDSIVTTTISLLQSDTIEISVATCDPDQAGISVENLHNVFGCDSIVTTFISLLPSSTTDLFETTCVSSETGVFVSTLINEYSCDSIVTLTVSLVDADTILFTYMTCFESEVGLTQTLYTGHEGCDSLVIEQFLLFPLSTLDVVSVQDYNGYDVSCLGGSDGAVEAITLGEEPFTFLWSNSETGQRVTGVEAGNYSVTVTDGNGCEIVESISLADPDLFMFGFEIAEPGCFDLGLGSIVVIPSGGVAPYSYSIDGTNFQSTPTFDNLGDGIYQITALDANECDATEIISIHVPLSVQVELGNDKVISIGDSATLQAVINLPFDSLASIMWSGIDNSICPTCPVQIVYPVITTAYSVEVTSVDGCADKDSINVFVSTEHDVYIPNIFSPNGDGINDELIISIGDGVEQITSFEIFDRWGNLVFGVNSITSGATTISWDGRFKGEEMNSGVFTYLMQVKYADGTREAKYGDITLIR